MSRIQIQTIGYSKQLKNDCFKIPPNRQHHHFLVNIGFGGGLSRLIFLYPLPLAFDVVVFNPFFGPSEDALQN